MHGGEGGRREIIYLLEHRGDNVREVGSGVILARVEALDVAACAKALALAAQDERAGFERRGLIEGAGEFGEVIFRKGIQGFRVVEYELNDSGFGVVFQVDHKSFS